MNAAPETDDETPASGVGRRDVGVWAWGVLAAILLAFAALTALYASFHPAHGRFYDERFALQNVHSVLQRGALEPANGYYPTLSYLPQTLALGLIDAAGGDRYGGSMIYRVAEPPAADADPPAAGAAFTPLAYGVSRGIQLLWGIAALLFLFALGRRAFGVPAALIAVGLLATSPWFLQSAAKFKPDISLLATSILALWLSARAAEHRVRWGRYAAAGAAIAAAMSCKLTGGITAVPLTLVSVVQARWAPRRLLGLGVAGATSLAFFLLLNPHLRLYLHFMERLSAEYADKAKAYGGTHWGVVRRSLELVTSEFGFGPMLGGLALLAFVVLGLSAVHPESPLRRPAPALLWLFAPLYLAAFAASTPHFKGNNVLSILPPLALCAGWLAVFVGRRLAQIPARLPRRLVLGLASSFALVAVASQASGLTTYVYQSVVPTTHDLANNWLKAELGRQPLYLLSDEAPVGRYRWEGATLGRSNVLVRFPWTDTEIGIEPPVYDGVLGPPARVDASPWSALAKVEKTRIEPAFLHARGPAVAVRARPWSAVGGAVQPAAEAIDGRLQITWPDELGSGWYTVEVWVPQPSVASLDPHLEIGGFQRPLAWRRAAGRGHLLTSPRFAHDARRPPPTVSLAIPASGEAGIAFAFYRWRPPQPNAPA
ncbi:MAG: glycosyltransferase family 39 protein [Acidobacteriota bacterium]